MKKTMEIKRDCIYCGCSKDKIKKRNSGPIIKIQCPECGYTITRGTNELASWKALVDRWNCEYLFENNFKVSKKEYEESAVRRAWDIVKYCRSMEICQDCVFVKYTEYRKRFKKYPFGEDGRKPKDWKPPSLDIFDEIQNYTQI